MANAKRLIQTLQAIKADKKHWHQGQYHSEYPVTCNSTHCFAGWAQLLFAPNTVGRGHAGCEAKRVLKITDDQRDYLFSAVEITFDELTDKVHNVIAGEID